MKDPKALRKDEQFISIISVCRKMIYESDTSNTLVQQLGDIAFCDLVYRSFNEGLRLDKDNQNRPKLIIDLFHEFFFKNQALSIRKIFDRDKSVYSLGRIFDLVYDNKGLFTRRGYLLAHQAKIDDSRKRGMADLEIEGLNKYYDLISRTPKSSRTELDSLYNPYLETIKDYLDKKTLIKRFTNTYIAHSSNKIKQDQLKNDLHKVSLRELQKTYKDISWLSYTLSYYIGDLILFEVPSIQYDQFEGWIGSVFKKDIKRSLITYWHKRSMMFENWKQMYWFSDKLYLTPKKYSNQ